VGSDLPLVSLRAAALDTLFSFIFEVVAYGARPGPFRIAGASALLLGAIVLGLASDAVVVAAYKRAKYSCLRMCGCGAFVERMQQRVRAPGAADVVRGCAGGREEEEEEES